MKEENIKENQKKLERKIQKEEPSRSMVKFLR